MIEFLDLEYQNFRTVGNAPITINFKEARSTLITGKNGHGKSTLIHALCYVLFNRAYGDDTTLPQLINSINLKKCLVTINFTSGTKRYRIVRGMKPKVFQIFENDILLNEDADSRDYQKILENQILKFNYRSFTQVVVIGGSDYKPFMKLKASDRREFIEDLLDIRIFSTMGEGLKLRNKELKEEMGIINAEIATTQTKIESQQSFISTLEKEKGDAIQRVRANIDRLTAELDEYGEQQSALIDKVEKYTEQLKPFSKLSESVVRLKVEIRQLKTRQEEVESQIEFFEGTTTCPTCSQDITEAHKRSITEVYGTDLDVLRADIEKSITDMEGLQKKVALHDKIQDKINELEQEIIRLNSSVKSHKRQIANAELEIEEMENDSISVDEEKEKLSNAEQDLISLQGRKDVLLTQKQEYEFMANVLSDTGIKAKIIKNYIPTINVLINKYLSALDFYVLFNLDEEFNEIIKSRYRDTFSYGNFSDGQKARIDLSLMLTWREMARMRNAVNCNIAIFDEADKAMDDEGTSLFSDLIKTLNIQNVVVISHKGDAISDKYDRCISMELVNNFTVMK